MERQGTHDVPCEENRDAVQAFMDGVCDGCYAHHVWMNGRREIVCLMGRHAHSLRISQTATCAFVLGGSVSQQKGREDISEDRLKGRGKQPGEIGRGSEGG